MSEIKGEEEPDYQSDPRAVLGSDGKKIRGSKRDNDLVAAVLILTMVFIILGLYAMTYMFR